MQLIAHYIKYDVIIFSLKLRNDMREKFLPNANYKDYSRIIEIGHLNFFIYTFRGIKNNRFLITLGWF